MQPLTLSQDPLDQLQRRHRKCFNIPRAVSSRHFGDLGCGDLLSILPVPPSSTPRPTCANHRRTAPHPAPEGRGPRPQAADGEHNLPTRLGAARFSGSGDTPTGPPAILVCPLGRRPGPRPQPRASPSLWAWLRSGWDGGTETPERTSPVPGPGQGCDAKGSRRPLLRHTRGDER